MITRAQGSGTRYARCAGVRVAAQAGGRPRKPRAARDEFSPRRYHQRPVAGQDIQLLIGGCAGPVARVRDRPQHAKPHHRLFGVRRPAEAAARLGRPRVKSASRWSLPRAAASPSARSERVRDSTRAAIRTCRRRSSREGGLYQPPQSIAGDEQPGVHRSPSLEAREETVPSAQAGSSATLKA